MIMVFIIIIIFICITILLMVIIALVIAYHYQAYLYKLYWPKNRTGNKRLRYLNYEKKLFDIGFRTATTCYMFPCPGKPQAIILYLHGNHSDIIDDEHLAKSLAKETESIVVYVDYRGYGGNDGLPSENGLIEDGETVMNWIQHEKQFANLPFFICGMSLGGAIALHLLMHGKHCIRGIIIINCFTTLRDIAREWLGHWMFNWLLCFLKETWNNTGMAKKHGHTAPALFISSINDNEVPSWMMKILYNQYGCRSDEKTLLKVPGGHNAFFRNEDCKRKVTSAIAKFFQFVNHMNKVPDDDDVNIMRK